MAKEAIFVKDLSFQYDEAAEWALKNIGFTLNYGEVLGIIGPTGAGKTTLAMCLNTLIPNVISGELKGEIIVDGQDISNCEVSDLATKVGFVFQEPENQLSQMTIEEEIAFGLGNVGVPRDEMITRISDVLAMVGLTGFEKRSPLALSGGQQQRLAIAAVLALQPSIMIMDEPTSMLDPRGKNEVYEVLKNIKEQNLTGIIIDHEVERVASYCDKVLILNEGEAAMCGTPENIFNNLDDLHRLKIDGPQVTELSARMNKELGFQLKHPVTLDEAINVFQGVPFTEVKK